MRVLDLFAGIGGFSLAAHWMGWETVAFVEKEPFPQKVLAKNFPGVEIYGDIFEFSGKPFRGSVDIITGGFPCQPFSAAGKRKGRNDERHLFPEMLRVISEVKPRWVVTENVRGLLSIESGQVFSEVVASLESEGYEVITFCVPASAIGAPHRRDRLWIVSRLLDTDADEREQGRNPGADAKAESDIRRNEKSDVSARLVQYDAPDASHIGLVRGFASSSLELAGGQRNAVPASGNDRSTWREPWPEAAARLCRMDDAVPDRVHRLKALGNSIVPGIAFEIFKAIQEAETI